MAAIDFIADEEEAENGIDFTPDPSPFVAQAPRPIIPPPQLAGDERAARRAILMAELQNEAARGQRTENIANRLGLLEGAIRPFASTPDNPLGGIGSALKGAGQIVAPITEASGNVAVGLFSDIGMGGISVRTSAR